MSAARALPLSHRQGRPAHFREPMTRDDRNDFLKLGAAGALLWLLLRGGRSSGTAAAATTLDQLAPPCRLMLLPGDRLELDGKPATIGATIAKCRRRRIDAVVRGDARFGFVEDTLAALSTAGLNVSRRSA